MTSVEIAIVGGGPAGCYLASKLAEGGLEVLVLEEHPTIGEPACCTGIIGRECLSLLDLSQPSVLHACRSASFYSPSGKRLRVSSAIPQAFVMDRAALDRALAERARERGARFCLGCRVREVALGRDGVRLEVEGAEPVEARAAVIAAGFPSGLARGLGEIGGWAMAAQAEVEAPGLSEVEVYLGRGVAPGFFAWLVPTHPGRGLAGVLSSGSGDFLRGFLSHLQAQGRISRLPERVCRRRLPLAALPRTYAERLLVVGEAAGQVKVTTGGGIYYGILGAEAAARTLVEAFRAGDLSAPFLSRYERDWRGRLEPELRWGRWARRVFARLSDPQLEGLFSLAEGTGLLDRLVSREGFSFDWHAPTLLHSLGMVASRGLLSLIPFRLPARGW